MTPTSAVTTFRRPDGHVFLTLERNRQENWIHSRWSGVQTIETVMEGSLFHIQMMREEPCPKLLNDHRELVGRFTDANDWIASVWTPLVLNAGLRYIGHVLSPGVFGQISIQDLHQRIGDQIEMCMFGSLDEAQDWMRSVG